MAWDDDDKWKPPADDPEVIENAKRQLRGAQAVQQRALRWMYMGIAVLVIVIVLVVVLK